MGKTYYRNSTEHLLAELEYIDVLIRTQVNRARHIQKFDSEFQGLYIPESQVDALLEEPAGLPQWATAPAPISLADLQNFSERIAARIAECKAESKRRGISLRLDRLTRQFGLEPFEIQTLLICLAPEFDLRYERLFAYLQDDVTRKKPSVDLVLNLLSPSYEHKLAARRYFSEEASLRKFQLLQISDDPSYPNTPLLGKYLKVDDRIVDYLHGSNDPDTALKWYARIISPRVRWEDLVLSEDIKQRFVRFCQKNRTSPKQMVFYFQGSYGVGKQMAAEALCAESGLKLLIVKTDQLLKITGSNLDHALSLIYREARLQDAAIYWSRFDALVVDDDHNTFQEIFFHELKNQTGVTFLAGKSAWEPMDVLNDFSFMRVEFPLHSYSDRLELWKRTFNGTETLGDDLDLSTVANKFRLTGGQIHNAAVTAHNLARWRNPETPTVNMKDLYSACRLQSNRNLGVLAQKITPHYCWDDIVLPGDRLRQLDEICNYVKYRARVFNEWGFGQKVSLGKGVNALFAGPSGTGKTMAAEVIAGELSLDLYKIDLSAVVSKYIGETEKHLAKIFEEAQTSNAILFFDEADALFGKRSEIRDSHDRYANIEISYLLQKMEEYEGIVILATNFRKNMDEAFVRRIHFTVEFPFPSEQDRLRIWEKIWPDQIPRSRELDLKFMARKFDISGGNIRNVALAAAFLAADDGHLVNMAHLIHAMRREYQKMGKVAAEGEFGKYAKI